jgi:hypothetical protein
MTASELTLLLRDKLQGRLVWEDAKCNVANELAAH